MIDSLHVYVVGGNGGVQVKGALSSDHGDIGVTDHHGLGTCAAMQIGTCARVA